MTASPPLQLPLNPAPEWSGPWASDVLPPGGLAQPRRVRLWNIGPDLHCSIIGTCLSLGEVRAFARKMGLCGDQAAEDHHLHDLVVFASGREDVWETAERDAWTVPIPGLSGRPVLRRAPESS